MASVERLTGEIAWQSLLARRVVWATLSVDGGEVIATRESKYQLRVAGQRVDLTTDDDEPWGATPVAQWLKDQSDLVVHGVTVRWIDQFTQAPPLVFTDIALVVQASACMHRAYLRATPRGGQGALITLAGEVEGRWFDSAKNKHAAPDARADTSAGRLYAELHNIDVAQWTPWVPTKGVHGRMSVRAWADAVDGRLGQARLDARGHQMAWQDAARRHIETDDVSVTLRGDSQAVAACWLSDTSRCGADGTAPLELTGDARAVGASTVPRADISRATIYSDDLQAIVRGQWHAQAGEAAGVADLHADIGRASLSAVHRYVPMIVAAPVRRWLRDALSNGSLVDAQMALHGPLMQFPFNLPEDDGEFTLDGRLVGARLKYAPHWQEGGNSGVWPMLTHINGRLQMVKASLTVEADEGALLQGQGRAVVVKHAVAHTDDLGADNAILAVDAQTEGDAQAYIDVLAGSPVGALVGGRLAQTRASGDMAVPLVLSIPLDETDDTAVRGEAIMKGVSFWPGQSIPPVTSLDGRLVFTREALRAGGLKGRWLGGPVAFSGTLSETGQDLNIDGRVAMDAVRRWRGDARPVLARAKGDLVYKASFGYDHGEVMRAQWDSDLRGLSLDLPLPFKKSADSSLPVSVTWLPRGEAGRGPARLDATIGDQTRMRFEQVSDASSRSTGVAAKPGEPIFTRGVVNIGASAGLPAEGLAVAARLDELNVVQWRDLIEDLSATPTATSTITSRSIGLIERGLQLQVSTPRLVAGRYQFNDASLSAEREPGSHSTSWRAHVASRQADGRIDWQSDTTGAPGKIDARLSRLWLEPSGIDDEEAGAVTDRAAQDLSGFPAISLYVDDFSVHGRALGELKMTGTNVNRGEQWRLDRLTVVNPASSLIVDGVWNAKGERRGLDATIHLAIADAGGLLSRVGSPNLVAQGAGTIVGRLFWQDSPWKHDLRKLDARFDVDLKSGRFVQVESASVKWLSLLSLQSLPRLASMQVDPAKVVQGGFVFDWIGSALRINKGVLEVEDYSISGPAARIRLDGRSDLVDRRWDMRARVVPNIDASGAALATTLINPILGAGALVTQWVMRAPLEHALTQQFRVRGHWENPEVEIDTATPDDKKAVQTPDGL